MARLAAGHQTKDTVTRSKHFIRPIAICVFRHHGRILVAEGFDPLKQQTFYRPLGGSIEFGELSRDTIVREMREELDAEATELRFLGALENAFTYNGEPGHEIVLVYDGRFSDTTIYERPVLYGREDSGAHFKAVWKPLADWRDAAAPPLYPDGLLALLQEKTPAA